MWFVILLIMGFSIAPEICILLLILFCAYMTFKGPGVIIAITLFVVYIVSKANHDSTRESTRRDIILRSESTDNFNPTKEIREKIYVPDYAVYIDEANRKIMFANLLANQRVIYRFDEILECTVFEDDKVARTTQEELYSQKQNPLVASLNPPRKKVQSLIIKISTVRTPYEILVITSPTEFYGETYVAKWRFARNVFDAVREIMRSVSPTT